MCVCHPGEGNGAGRLNAVHGWVTDIEDGAAWWQMDVGSVEVIAGVVIQDVITQQGDTYKVTKMKIETSIDGSTWLKADQGETYQTKAKIYGQSTADPTDNPDKLKHTLIHHNCYRYGAKFYDSPMEKKNHWHPGPGQLPCSDGTTPVYARYIRIVPTEWQGAVAMRSGVLLCNVGGGSEGAPSATPFLPPSVLLLTLCFCSAY